MATITFKAKPKPVYNADMTLSHHVVLVPQFRRSHCDMPAFRQHPKYGGLANSSLFHRALSRIRRDRLGEYFRMDKVPAGVTIDATGFLLSVSIEV